jgi:predicted ATPase
MPFVSLAINGFRGFSTTQELKLALPSGAIGSGLTTIVGPNNAGKSTVTEAIRAVAHQTPPSFADGRRNKKAGDRIEITIVADTGATKTLRTIASGGSETESAITGNLGNNLNIFSLPSRRYFSPLFNRGGDWGRGTYVANDPLPNSRANADEKGAQRLFAVQKNRAKFDQVLEKIMQPVPDWKIDQADSGQYYLKFSSGEHTHTSEGMGEGLVSLFLIVDALYDSNDGDTIVIDEPELSLHPAFQRKLALVLREFSGTRQIICSTHSPYFIDLLSFTNGGSIVRVYNDTEGSKIAPLSDTSRKNISGFLRNLSNPHIVGLDAREVFFLEDKIILVEGQEDSIIYPMIAEQLGLGLKGDVFGWGIGGADNMEIIAQILKELGFKKVFGILDGNKRERLAALKKAFPIYSFEAIAANDVRSKPAVAQKEPVDGLTDSKGKLLEGKEAAAKKIIEAVNNYLA